MRPTDRFSKCVVVISVLLSGLVVRTPAQDALATLLSRAEVRDGFVRVHLDRPTGRLIGEFPVSGRFEFLLSAGLARGLGSNPIGLDRGRLGRERVVRVEMRGPKAVFLERNLRFRATTRNRHEDVAVADSFAGSVLYAGEILGTRDEHVFVDLTPLVVSDLHGVRGTLRQAKQGTFKLDAGRSHILLETVASHPDNLECEARLTFVCDEPGALVREVAPDPTTVTVRQHLSLVRLPPTGFEPRAYHVRCGYSPLAFDDLGAPLEEEVRTLLIRRHRLEPVPGAVPDAEGRVAVVEPIVYYVDRGIPEPIRSAVVEGASWWNEAFEAAGFRDAFVVRLLPEDADPLDVRFNVIQWVHRSTRGWSYGGSISDPRTGEIIKGHVRLGSLRIRQDRLLYRGIGVGLESNRCMFESGPDLQALVTEPDRLTELALARIRQLAAHEVGHTLGLAHNFAASVNDRASVMDYPAPLVRVDHRGGLDVSRAYATGIGAWDRWAIRYGYGRFDDAETSLPALVAAARDAGLLFLTDGDARPAGAADWRGSLWDNGSDPVAELERVLEVRNTALARFSDRVLERGVPRARLLDVFAPLYLHHRYQVVATAKCVGGYEYDHAAAGEHSPHPRKVDRRRQEMALAALLRAISPEVLDVPDEVTAILAPPASGLADGRERLGGRTDPIFDPIAAAGVAADMVLNSLLEPHRLERLALVQIRDDSGPTLSDVLERLVAECFESREPTRRRYAALRRVVRRRLVDRLGELAGDRNRSGGVAATIELTLRRLSEIAAARSESAEDAADRGHFARLAAELKHILERRSVHEPTRLPPAPPGSPIGAVRAGRR